MPNLKDVKWYSVSYEVLKNKGFFVWSLGNGKRYCLQREPPMPSFMWKKLHFLPKHVDVVKTQVGSKTYYKLYELGSHF